MPSQSTDKTRLRYSICHLEIPAPDLKATTRFYEEVFGWKITFSRATGHEYAFFDDGGVGGGFDPRMSPRRDGVNLVVTVDDIEAMLENISRHGGETLVPRTDIGEGHGFFAEFIDPAGNRLGLWTKE